MIAQTAGDLTSSSRTPNGSIYESATMKIVAGVRERVARGVGGELGCDVMGAVES
jgi:pheromone shutdown protein TraB